MRALASLAVVVLVSSACPAWLAPPATSGAPAGDLCSVDVECASGLACECGVCVEPTGQPPRCLALDDGCGDVPSDCFRACGDPAVVGRAECIGGRESCSASGGVLRSQCPANECWEAPAPGEICVDGALRCELPPRAPNGECYTDDCEGAPGGCVTACADGAEPVPQVCLASEWQCEAGVSVESCGACVGAAPSCVLDCAVLEPTGSAACDASLEWSCAHIVQNGTPAKVIAACCEENPAACPDAGTADDAGEPDGGEEDGGDVDGGDVDGGAQPDAGLPNDDGGQGPLDAGDDAG